MNAAVANQNAQVIKLLIEAGANIDDSDEVSIKMCNVLKVNVYVECIF